MRRISYLNEGGSDKKTNLSELDKDRIDEVAKKIKLKEAAFRAGNASKMIDKIASVLTKRVGIPIGISSIPEVFQNSSGTFEGFFGFIGNSRALRLNFLKGKSDYLRSIDIYDNATEMKPSQTIDLNGYNIVQVINQVVDVITGEYERYEEGLRVTRNGRLQERLKVHEIVTAWLEENPTYLQDISRGSFDYERYTGDFIDFARDKFSSKKQSIKAAALQYNVRLALDSNPNLGVKASSVPGVTVTPAQPEVSLADPALQAMWEEVQNVSPKIIMENLEQDIRLIANNDPLMPGVLVYGKPGTGKTQTIMDTFEEEGVKPVMIDEKITAYTKFMGAMHQYKDGEIIVIDDNDSVFDTEENVNLLKKLLDMKPVRRVNITFPIKVSGTGSKDEAYIIENSFDFESKIVFISNKTEIDSAIESRLSGVMHEINFSKEEMLELIKENLSGLYADVPELTDDLRNEVYDFVESIMGIVSDIDYRAFNFCLSYRLAEEKKSGGGQSWKQRSMKMLGSYKKKTTKKK